MTTTLTVGDRAPELDLPGDTGQVQLADLRGRPAVIYFYPKDDTSGCTAEAQDFTLLAAQFADAGVAVVGVSKDSPQSHAKFRAKYALSPILASDATGKVVEDWGVWVEKSLYGRKYMGIERATFLIDAAGSIRRIWRKVKVKTHAAEVLEAARGLPAKSA
jgi:peroxiredoxin Q/BCP